MQPSSNYQENQGPVFFHGHPNYQQVPYQYQCPGSISDLDDSLDSIIFDATPPFSQGPFINVEKAQDLDIEMTDAPPLDQHIYDQQSVSGSPLSAFQTCRYTNLDAKVVERIVSQALQSQQVNVDALMYQVFMEIGDLKQQNKQLSDTVINMIRRSWGVTP